MKYTGLLILIFSLVSCNSATKATKDSTVYEPTWESLNQHETPDWLLDAKLGIYGHWGIYSVPAFKTEWYGRLMYDTLTRGSEVYEHHRSKYGNQSEFGYKDFISGFTAENFDPDEWARVIKSSGARYAGITVVHHDGFCLWDSKYTEWDSKDQGPKRDLYGDLVKAIRETDPEMKILSCFHHYRTYGWFYTRDSLMEKNGREEEWDIYDPEYAGLYWNPEYKSWDNFLTEWEHKIKEVIDTYQPDVIWFDGGNFRAEKNEPTTMEVLSHFYNTQNEKGTEVEVINKKTNFHPEFGLRNFEKGGNRPASLDFSWVDDLNIANRGWCYTYNISYRSVNQIIDGFIDRVSRGGGLMLSISPMADGTIPEEQKTILKNIGDWLAVNGDGIYGTRKWKIETEGDSEKFRSDNGKKIMWNFEEKGTSEDVRFTRKGNRLFAFLLDCPEDRIAHIHSLGTDTRVASGGISGVKLLGSDEKLEWERDENGLHIIMPAECPSDYAVGFEVLIDGKLDMQNSS